jgi:hypothetical protein
MLMKRPAGIAFLFLGLLLAAAPASMAGPPELVCDGPFSFGFHPGRDSLVRACIALDGHPIAMQAFPF